MLVTFNTDVYAPITMFGDVAVALLKLMGHSGAIPSALLAEDISAALQRLEQAVAANPNAKLDPNDNKNDDDDRPGVSLTNRALPLIELLKAAAKDGKNVMWESS